MINYMFTPLHKHIDGGFGVMAEAFEQAADRLAEVDQEDICTQIHLPINFLYRHAVELYLKSVIIVIHRSLGLSYGGKPADLQPYVRREGKWLPIDRVHSVGTLYAYFKSLVVDNKEAIDRIARTNWSAVPPELDEAIAVIDKADSASTYFRYPIPQDPVADHNKSSWKDAPPTKILHSTKPGAKPVRAFLVVDEDEQIVNSYQYDDEPLRHLREALRKATELLSGAHTGLRVELAGGR